MVCQILITGSIWQSLIQQTKANDLLQISFCLRILRFIFKIASCAVCGDFGTSLLLCLSHLFTFAILLRSFMLILPGRHSSSHENKSWQSLYIFLKPWYMNVRYFKLTWWYAWILLLILCSFDLGLCQGYFVRLKKNVS